MYIGNGSYIDLLYTGHQDRTTNLAYYPQGIHVVPDTSQNPMTNIPPESTFSNAELLAALENSTFVEARLYDFHGPTQNGDALVRMYPEDYWGKSNVAQGEYLRSMGDNHSLQEETLASIVNGQQIEHQNTSFVHSILTIATGDN